MNFWKRSQQVLLDAGVALFLPWKLARRMAKRELRFRCLGLPAWMGILVMPCLAIGLFQTISTDLSPATETALPAPQAGMMAAISEGLVSTEFVPSRALAVIGVGIPCWWIGGFLAGVLGAALFSGLLVLALVGSTGKEQKITDLWKVASRASVWFPISAYASIQIGRLVAASMLEGATLSVWSSVVALALGVWVLFGFGAIVAGWLKMQDSGRPARAWLLGAFCGLASVVVVMAVTFVAWNTALLYRPILGLSVLFR